MRRSLHVCLSCERRGRRAAPRLCSETFRIVCQNCQDQSECIPSVDTVGRVVTVQGKHLYYAPCCAGVREYLGSGQDFVARPHWNPDWLCPHQQLALSQRPKSACAKSSRLKCAAWNCQTHALPRQHVVLDHLEGTLETYHLCHRHTPPEEWLRRAKNFRQFTATCCEWDAKVRTGHRK